MAVDESDPDRHDRTSKRRPFSSWMRKFAQFKGGDQHQQSSRKPDRALGISRQKKSNVSNQNNPYPESGRVPHIHRSSSTRSMNGPSTASHIHSPMPNSFESLSGSPTHRTETLNGSNRSAAPTVATFSDTIHSEAAQSRAATTTTGAGALSFAGAGSTFSSPNPSEHSLTTTLTTMHSQNPGNLLPQHTQIHNSNQSNGNNRNADPVMFSHQYPISPIHSTNSTISAIPRHMNDSAPSTYASATANNLLSDNASIITLASSSKRRRRSMESHTDASVRAIPPSSIWSGSRESLPLSVLSGAHDISTGHPSHAHNRPSISGLTSVERASIYSNQGVSAPALASERNSYYATSQKQTTKDIGDAKSLRSFTNIDARSQYDTKSINDAKSTDLSSLRNYEGSIRSGAIGHGRNDSTSGGPFPVSPGPRHAGAIGALSRRSSDWQGVDEGEG